MKWALLRAHFSALPASLLTDLIDATTKNLFHSEHPTLELSMLKGAPYGVAAHHSLNRALLAVDSAVRQRLTIGRSGVRSGYYSSDPASSFG